MRVTQIDLVAVLCDVVEPCLTASVRRGELKRGEVEELSLSWRNEHIGVRDVATLELNLVICGEVFTFYVVSADTVDSFEPQAAADRLDERLQVFIADVIGHPTLRDFL